MISLVEKLKINNDYKYSDRNIWDKYNSFDDNGSTLEKGEFVIGYDSVGQWDSSDNEKDVENSASIIYDYIHEYKNAGGETDITQDSRSGGGEQMLEFEGNTPECKKIIKQLYYFTITGKQLKDDVIKNLTDKL